MTLYDLRVLLETKFKVWQVVVFYSAFIGAYCAWIFWKAKR